VSILLFGKYFVAWFFEEGFSAVEIFRFEDAVLAILWFDLLTERNVID
jgi:hypothetical protein